MLKIFDRISSRSLPQVLPQEIICGNCCGEATLPIRTNITSDGRCAVCGGRSFVPASTVCEALARHLKHKKIVERQLDEYGKTYENGEADGDCFAIESTFRN